MKTRNNVIQWLEELSAEDTPYVGSKAANLGELASIGVPVPPAFVVTADTYFQFIKQAQLSDVIRRHLENLDVDDAERLEQVAARIKKLIVNAEMPRQVAEAITEANNALGSPLVAVRSSAVAEDLPEAAFAGPQSSYLNVGGAPQVVAAVKRCWASVFEPGAIFYRAHQSYDHLAVGVAVLVQQMVQADTSGVMFTVEPVSNDTSKMVVEAVVGLGEAIVTGSVTPDLYVLDKASLTILSRDIAVQEWKLSYDPNAAADADSNLQLPLAQSIGARQKLTDEDIRALTRIGIGIEEHFGWPQDIEWAKEGDQFYVVQTRPVASIAGAESMPGGRRADMTGKLLVSGSSASPGVASGAVRLIFDASQIDQVLEGDILVAPFTNPDFVPAMERAAAIVTDTGGRTSHAAIASRELGIPCVVGTEVATKVLQDRQLVTVDGTWGRVLEGIINIRTSKAGRAKSLVKIETNTKIYVNLAAPELAASIAKRDVDGVGLLRAEFIVAHIGEHPRHALSQGRGEEFIEKLAAGITKFAGAFYPRPVLYRAMDFKANEYRNLKGGHLYETVEENPMLGYRGAFRYINDTDIFKMEIEAIKRVRRRFTNLSLMLPFVRTVRELVEAKKVLSSTGLRRSKTFELWMMAEVPANIFLLDQFLDVGVDGISIGSNDLTQLILGADRDNPKLAELFDERNPAVLLALEHIVTTCKRRKVQCSICGQAPSVYPEVTRKLVEWGISSVSVSPDMIDETRRIIAESERRLTQSTQERVPASSRVPTTARP